MMDAPAGDMISRERCTPSRLQLTAGAFLRHDMNAMKTSARPMLDPLTDDAELIDYCPGLPPAERCKRCGGSGLNRNGCDNHGNKRFVFCELCEGIGFHNINPTMPCLSYQGTRFKQAMMAARDSVGISVWNPLDGRDDE